MYSPESELANDAEMPDSGESGYIPDHNLRVRLSGSEQLAIILDQQSLLTSIEFSSETHMIAIDES